MACRPAKAGRCVSALTAIADAGPGGVLVHCGIGRDRTGLIALLVLALAGVTTDAIVEDYALSGDRLRTHFGRDDDPVVERLAEHGTTIHEVLSDLLTTVDIEDTLRVAGLKPDRLTAIRARISMSG
ncbi:tyrosine-protein phosphatase [Actinoplanes sp. LDG1-06]|uniref:Tyrosine-protein phosphatase n=1 Tax=Paractinoplanes ovalisporus TaxID=2810368 RepID=A0ABS2AHU5_9ACTN|nr:tyrosine-protein phosphatase [Actinoplanes ovalisporus]